MDIGLIGAGRVGALHAQVLVSLEEVENLLVSDVIRARSDELAAQHGASQCVALDDLFDRSDAVVIASSTNTHAELIERAAQAGMPAFCEKPIALDLASTRRAMEAVEAAGVAVQIGFQRRYDPAIRAIHDQIADGDLGAVYLVRSQTHDPAPPELDYIAVSGGIFKDCLIHDIDAVRYVTGQEVVSVRAAGAATTFSEIAEVGDVDSATVMLEMSAGALGQLSGLRHDPMGYDVRLEVFGSRTSVAAGWSDRTPIRSMEPGVPEPRDPFSSWLERFGTAYRAEMQAFIEVVGQHAVPASTPRDAYEDLRVATACDLSLRENRTVYLEEIQ